LRRGFAPRMANGFISLACYTLTLRLSPISLCVYLFRHAMIFCCFPSLRVQRPSRFRFVGAGSAFQCDSVFPLPAALRLILLGAVRVNRHPSCAVLALPRPLAICSSIPSCQCLKVPRGHLRRCCYSHLATGLNSSGSPC
jgi:hypothetical protein